jgi:sRNA-binding carbon storage regulator CsrA
MGWLVLELRPDETVHLGPSIRVCIHRIRGNSATVAIAAPPDVRVLRDEVLEKHPHLIETLGKPQPFAGLSDLICRTIESIPMDDRLDHAADARRVLRRLLAELTATKQLDAINATLATPPAPTKATP